MKVKDKNMNVIKLSRGLSENKIPIAKRTIYRWHRRNKYPGLILKFGGKLYWNEDKWESIIEQKMAD